MKRHSTDLVSLVFGLVFAGIAGWWLIGRYVLDVHVDVPNLGLFIAGGLIVLGLLGVIGSLRREPRAERRRAAERAAAAVTPGPPTAAEPAAFDPTTLEPATIEPTTLEWPPDRLDTVDPPAPAASDEADPDESAGQDRDERTDPGPPSERDSRP